ncbi:MULTISPECIES: Abi family protein [Acetobacter]|mgnify:CR=1 FL=1|uniref:Abi family protein n=1 Tax=Acetobacter TaxID=434 RepID=UPI003463DB77
MNPNLMLIPYCKPHLNSAGIVAHLASLGLIINNSSYAQRQIELLGYHRLRIYFLSRRDLTAHGKPFYPNVTFEHVISLYNDDRKIRSITFDAIGVFELLFRNAFSEKISALYGSHPYMNDCLYRHPDKKLPSLQFFTSTYLKSKDQRAKHYLETYEPFLPPIWILKEFFTFGQSINIFQALSDSIQRDVAIFFGISERKVFESWLKCLLDLRNACAHHDRIFNKTFSKNPRLLRRANVPHSPANKLKALLECLDYMTFNCNSATGSVTSVLDVITSPESNIIPLECGY